jgi:hydrogenase expression/formation protein HypE
MTTATEPLSCPTLDATAGDRVTLAHGEGGKLMRQLIREMIMPPFRNSFLQTMGDAAVLPACQGKVAITTDSFVVSPLFFPGGDIGSLAVYGTVNDLAVAGARPLWISLALILEEGLELNVLHRVLESVAAAAGKVGVPIVTGDTKVVPRGAADRLFINTTGVGEIVGSPPVGPAALLEGDEILVTGPIGQHGMAVMVAREELAFAPAPTTDSASLVEAVEALRRARIPVRALRDATRGGVAAVLQEWAEASGKTILVREEDLPVSDAVRGACELLGLDPIHVANEGTMVLAVEAGFAAEALQALQGVAVASEAAVFGKVVFRRLAPVVVQRTTGSVVPLDEPVGAPLPRIC